MIYREFAKCVSQIQTWLKVNPGRQSVVGTVSIIGITEDRMSSIADRLRKVPDNSQDAAELREAMYDQAVRCAALSIHLMSELGRQGERYGN